MKKTLSILIILTTIIAGTIVLMKNNYKQTGNTDSKKLQVYASFYPMYFFTSQIARSKADVYNITPASTEPHDYEPTTRDIAKITKASMLVLNGGHLESWGEKLKDQLQGSSVLVVTAGDNLANKEINEDGKAIQDPHIWLDPLLAKEEVVHIEKGFEQIDPANKSYYQQSAKSLEEKLDQLNTDYKNGLRNCSKKDFVTSHAAFGYLAARYGLTQIPISGISPDEEPAPKKLAEISDLVKKENIKIIFFESLISPKLSETIANETGAQTKVLDPIEGISDDEVKQGKNYFAIMHENLTNLQSALECKR